MIQAFAFYLFATIVIASGVMTIASRNPVHSVLWLILAFFNAAGLFVTLGAEFIAMLLVIVYVGAVAVLFWGGWLPPVEWAPLYYIPGIFWFFLKILTFFFVFSWVKATVPRFRYDQLMRLGWKIFLPFSLIWVFLVSGYLEIVRFGVLK